MIDQTLQRVTVELDISAERFIALYQGTAKEVLATSTEGKRVRFPANILRPFVTSLGVQGRFEICFTWDNRFHSINELN